MMIPNFQNEAFTDRQGNLTDNWQLILQNLFSLLQKGIGTEGFQISQVSSDPNSTTPPTTGGQLARIQSSFGTDNGVVAGTIVFDPYEVNGGTIPPRNGQLKVMLLDGTFHSITNT